MPHMLFPLPKYAGKWVLNETTKRSLLKTLTWRVTGSGATLLISWLISGTWSVAGSITVIQIIVNTVLYYFHERVWNCIRWGKHDPV